MSEPIVNPRTAEALRGMGIKSGYAIDGEALPRGFGRNGGLFCPVCRQEAERFIVSEEKRRLGWVHKGRPWPCTRAMGQDARDRSVADTAAGTDGTTSAPEA